MINAISSSAQQTLNSGGALQTDNNKVAAYQKPEGQQQDQQNKIQPKAAEASSSQQTSAQSDQTATNVDVYAAADQAKAVSEETGQPAQRGSALDISV